jgi:hypothetical protein
MVRQLARVAAAVLVAAVLLLAGADNTASATVPARRG